MVPGIANISGRIIFADTCGILESAAQLRAKADSAQAVTLDAALHRLTDASEMGTLFKVLEVRR